MSLVEQLPLLGYCHCGCGEKTRLAPHSSAERNWTRGEPIRFVHGHFVSRRDRTTEYRADEETGCWLWQKYVDPKNGYGCLNVSGIPGHYAHRVYYIEHKGPIPDGLWLDHLCRTRACVNPDHLEPVTPVINAQRSAQAKLTVEKVREIRASADRTGLLAERYGMSPVTIRKIRRGEGWPNAFPDNWLERRSAA